MRTVKFYRLVIVCLIIINLTTIGFLFFGKRGHRPPHPGHLTEILGFKGEKLKMIEELEKKHHIRKRALMKKSKKLYSSLYKTLGNGEKGKTILDSLTVNNEKIDSMTYSFFNTIAKNCNQEQLRELHHTVEKSLGHLWSKKAH
ncbi:MAG: hypothetical protein MK066_05735 [Crocinitomicaceae bacterium]|nr:hypothetical protein [Crocinitomicaceae bacterium]